MAAQKPEESFVRFVYKSGLAQALPWSLTNRITRDTRGRFKRLYSIYRNRHPNTVLSLDQCMDEWLNFHESSENRYLEQVEQKRQKGKPKR